MYNLKGLAAHELGHAIQAVVQDNGVLPTDISFEKSEGALAYCNFEYVDDRELLGKYSKFEGISNLGGLFGELLMFGKFIPWGARQDIDSFTSTNSNKKHQLIVELDKWMWVDNDKDSFRTHTNHADLKKRRQSFMLSPTVSQRLPETWECFLDFCSRIDTTEFVSVIEEIAKEKIKTIDRKEMFKYVERIVNFEGS